MGRIDVVKIGSKRELHDFIRVPYHIYEHCPQYVPDLESSICELFDPQKNPAFEFSHIQPFVAYSLGDDQSAKTPVGRIVGIINRKANERWQTRHVRFALIEFVDDEEVSRALVDAVAQWGRSFGMDAIEGPMGITDFDKEGMLVEDFNLTGTMNTIYNPAYYPRHMEALGFRKAVDWLQVRIQVPQEVPARYARTAQYAREQIGLRVIKLTNSDIMKGGYGKKVFDLLNTAYHSIFGFSELSERQVNDFMDKYLKLIDKKLIPVVVNDQEEIVGVAITMGCLSHAMQKAKGRLWPIGWWHLLKAMKWQREESAEMLLVAVRPDYQGLGVNALFFDDLIPIYNQYGFRWAETGPQLEDNVRELSQWKPLNPEFVKRRRCFIKEISA
ncbi:MAG: N-acetyltransferase [Prevotella sp.]|jgi:GNAT superfamily N-acetyltransferase|nr:N-acetyltransferase [Prevotella sp.]MBQ5496464.1 N-acetyltransferase [Prevotella sp.]